MADLYTFGVGLDPANLVAGVQVSVAAHARLIEASRHAEAAIKALTDRTLEAEAAARIAATGADKWAVGLQRLAQGDAATKATAALEAVKAATTGTTVASTGLASAFELSGQGAHHLRTGLTVLLAQATGMNPVVARLTSTLLMMSTGGPVAVGVVAGLGAIAFAVARSTEAVRKHADEVKKMAEAYTKAKQEMVWQQTPWIGIQQTQRAAGDVLGLYAARTGQTPSAPGLTAMAQQQLAEQVKRSQDAIGEANRRASDSFLKAVVSMTANRIELLQGAEAAERYRLQMAGMLDVNAALVASNNAATEAEKRRREALAQSSTAYVAARAAAVGRQLVARGRPEAARTAELQAGGMSPAQIADIIREERKATAEEKAREAAIQKTKDTIKAQQDAYEKWAAGIERARQRRIGEIESINDTLRVMQEEVNLGGKSADQREEAAIRAKGATESQIEVYRRLRGELKALQDTQDAVTASQFNQNAMWEALKRRTEAAAQPAKAMEEAYRRSVESVTDIMAGFFENFATKGIDSVRDFANEVLKTMNALAARLLALKLFSATESFWNKVFGIGLGLAGSAVSGGGGGTWGGSGAGGGTNVNWAPPPSTTGSVGPGFNPMVARAPSTVVHLTVKPTFHLASLDPRTHRALLTEQAGTVVGLVVRGLQDIPGFRLAAARA